MHLKSLTVKGFKSFASRTTLHFEPGVTCVVGPNGSGKSNVVDAIAWVLGEQGAKSLRGGKMEDVIFAGTRSRPPLGRAEVLLTIDNADGALPIDYAEVTISRLMYRSGESEYAINGERCRLLDVTELLSDSGIGREMHVIVGQGQLDAVLHAAPEDRRAYIEESAGILKHRRRKEKALRKLTATDQNLARLSDLLTEIRRQLKPLGRQAEAARTAATVQATARDARLRLTADDLSSARALASQADGALHSDRARLEELTQEFDSAQVDFQRAEERRRRDARAVSGLRETEHRLERLLERCTGVLRLARERAVPPPEPGMAGAAGRPDPDALDAEASVAQAEADAATSEVSDQRAALDARIRERAEAETRAAAAEADHLAAVRAHSSAAERRVRLREQVEAAQRRWDASQGEVARCAAELADAGRRSQAASASFEQRSSSAGGLDADLAGLDARYEAAETEVAGLDDLTEQLRRELEEARRQRSEWQARAEALELGVRSGDGVGALLADGDADRPVGVLGLVGASVSVAAGFEAALGAALGPAAEAVAVAGVDRACGALEWLREREAGRAGIVVARGVMPGDSHAPVPVMAPGAAALVPAGLTRLSDLVSGPDPVAGTVRVLVADVVIAESLGHAREIVTDRPDLRAVTREGDLVGALWASGGTGTPSVIEVHAAHEDALSGVARTSEHVSDLERRLTATDEQLAHARRGRDAALAELHASDATIAAVEQELAQLRSDAERAERETRRRAEELQRAESEAEAATRTLAELRERLDLSGSDSAPEAEPSSDGKDEAAALATQSRARETEARLELRTGEEKVRLLHDRVERLRRAARAEREAIAERERALLRMRRAAHQAAGLADVASHLQEALGVAVGEAAAARKEHADDASRGEAEAAALRSRTEQARSQMQSLAERLHRHDVTLAEQRVRVSDLEARVRAELRMDPDDLVAEYGPEQALPDGGQYDRTEQQERLAKAEKELARLGTVNPLAMEEFAALEERHEFLMTQVEDVKTTRRELMTVVTEIDERIRTVFAQAFEDVAAEFTEVFSALFPGGEGRLVLTDPDDPLGSGVEVEARPPGKKVKRLSLLSGGERSLTALAMLVAIFRARPSPFYVLDEVEAALDDTNLDRLVGLLSSLRESSQLIVITHQKRTMEAGDALYGVSMQSDGISQVISQRLRPARVSAS